MASTEATVSVWLTGSTLARTDLLYLLSAVAQSAAAVVALVVTLRLLFAQTNKRYEVPVAFVGRFDARTWVFYSLYATALLGAIALMLTGSLGLAVIPTVFLALGVLYLPFYIYASAQSTSLTQFFRKLVHQRRLRRQHVGDLFHIAIRAMRDGDETVFRRSALLLFSVDDDEEDGGLPKSARKDFLGERLARDSMIADYWQMTIDTAIKEESFALALFEVLHDCTSEVRTPYEGLGTLGRTRRVSAVWMRLRRRKPSPRPRNPFYSPMLVRRIAEDFADILRYGNSTATKTSREKAAKENKEMQSVIHEILLGKRPHPAWYQSAVETIAAILYDEWYADAVNGFLFQESGYDDDLAMPFTANYASELEAVLRRCDPNILKTIALGNSSYIELEHRPSASWAPRDEAPNDLRSAEANTLKALRFFLLCVVWDRLTEKEKAEVVGIPVPDDPDIWKDWSSSESVERLETAVTENLKSETGLCPTDFMDDELGDEVF